MRKCNYLDSNWIGPEETVTTEVGGVGLDEESRSGSRQAFFEGEGSIVLDSN